MACRKRSPALRGLYHEGWVFLDRFDLDPRREWRVVLRHNKELQHGRTLREDEKLSVVLYEMMGHCAAKGNPKITGPVKVAQHARLNNVPLLHFLDRELRRDAAAVVGVTGGAPR